MKKCLKLVVILMLCVALLFGTMATAAAETDHSGCDLSYVVNMPANDTSAFSATHSIICNTHNEKVVSSDDPCTFSAADPNFCEKCGGGRVCTLTFMNGTELFMEAAVRYGVTLRWYGMPTPEPPQGKIFGGWYTEEDGNGTLFLPHMTVQDDYIFYISWVDAPIILSPTGPQDIYARVGDSVTMTIEANGAERYQWLVDHGDGMPVPVERAEGPRLTIDSVRADQDGYRYFCSVGKAQGAIVSPTFTLHVIDDAPIPETGDGIDLFVFAGLALAGLFGTVALKKKEQH